MMGVKMHGCLRGEARNPQSRLRAIRDPMTIVWPMVAWNIAEDILHVDMTSEAEFRYRRQVLLFKLVQSGLPIEIDCIDSISADHIIMGMPHPTRYGVFVTYSGDLWLARTVDPGYTIVSYETRSITDLAAWYRRL